MQCFYALTGYFSRVVNPSGRRSIVFDKRKSFSGVPILVPCGKCIGCLMRARRDWAVRCLHEKRMYSASSFLTLTYSDEFLPKGGTLVMRDFQLFMKRLRLKRPVGLRFFACGEYGDTTLRPHYHVLLFNTDFPDMRFHKSSATGSPMYRSAELSSLWTVGDHEIGSVDPRSCAYVAGYIMKKVGSAQIIGREPEFRLMSRRPGIGYKWFLKYMDEAYRHDSVILEYQEVGLPRYYDTLYDGVNHDRMKLLKRERRAALFDIPASENETPRSMVRERFEVLKASRFRRDGSDG
ncbi:replication initiator protein [Blackfly microvirus SF02]|uniref:Replication initiator protein n=1 Tax=Blackfly microvirus SF02 TaxID=2576452 RepID=A0A4P8PLB7_9VIRU|nr:replication initiator protein [Blackfly microvirus SF02]